MLHYIKVAMVTLLLFFSFQSIGQTGDTLIEIQDYPEYELKDFLVDLAWKNNPKNAILDNNIEIAKYDVDLAKLNWFEDVTLAFNLNENNIDNSNTQNNGAFFNPFPKYNFQATFNLGSFVERPAKIRKAKEMVKIEKHTKGQEKFDNRNKVYKYYQIYTNTKELLRIRSQLSEDYSQNYILVSNQFKNGTVSFDKLNQASTAFQKSKEGEIEANAKLILATLNLEMLIGIPLDEAISMFETAKGL